MLGAAIVGGAPFLASGFAILSGSLHNPFAFSNQRYTPLLVPPKGYYYQPYQNNNPLYPNHRPSVRIEYYPDTQYEGSYRRESFVVGNELPDEFRSERYVVRDWDSYSLA